MKKAFGLVFTLIIAFLAYQLVVVGVKKTHTINYIIEKDNYIFKVNEHFDNNKYYFDITNNNYSFIFDMENNFNKNKEIIKDILFKESDDMLCIYPVYKKGNTANITCSDKINSYSYFAVKDRDFVINFVNEIKVMNYTSLNFDIKDINPTEGKVTLYKPNLNNEVLALWDYKGIIVSNHSISSTDDYLGFDRYDNTLGSVVGKYYVMPVYLDNNLFEVKSFRVYNLTNNDVFNIDLDFNLSNQSYINGIIDNKLYIFDKSNMKQVEINPKKKTAIVTSDDRYAKYYNNKIEDRNIYDFVNSELKFNYIENEELKNSYSNIYNDKDSYYIYDDNTLYQIYKYDISKKKVLLTKPGLKEIIVKNNNVYYIKDDSIYRYNNNDLEKILLSYRELRYNYKNIYGIY